MIAHHEDNVWEEFVKVIHKENSVNVNIMVNIIVCSISYMCSQKPCII